MKKLILVFVALTFLSVPALASVTGTVHDVGTDGDKQCENCHVPHGATQQSKLWADPVGTEGTYTDIQKLCWSCHRSGGSGDASSYLMMDVSLENHEMNTIGDCSGSLIACHDVHEQQATGGHFMTVAAAAGSGSFCETCHDGLAPTNMDFTAADALGDHTNPPTNHYMSGGFDCDNCHLVHGAVPQSSGTVNVILRDDNVATYYGDLCLGCHETAATGYDGVVSADQWGYAQALNDGLELTHPTTALAATQAGRTHFAGGCNKCHDVHGSAANAFILKVDNTNSAYCVACHDGTDGPDVGTSHVMPDMSLDASRGSGATNPMPWADDIMESAVGDIVQDWPSATADLMVCETCHSVHGRGTGTESDHFLRNDNSDNGICINCHADN